MTYRDEIMAMAQEAGLGYLLPAVGDQPAQWYGSDIKALEAFAVKEREACAKVCLQMAKRAGGDIRTAALEVAAENISARGQ